MAKKRAAAPARGGRPPVPRRGRPAGRRVAMADTDDTAPTPGLDVDVIAQLVGAVTGLAQFVQTLQQGPAPAPAPAHIPPPAPVPQPEHVQVPDPVPVPSQAPVVVPVAPEARATSAMREFYRLAPPTFHGQAGPLAAE